MHCELEVINRMLESASYIYTRPEGGVWERDYMSLKRKSSINNTHIDNANSVHKLSIPIWCT